MTLFNVCAPHMLFRQSNGKSSSCHRSLMSNARHLEHLIRRGSPFSVTD